MTKPDPEIVHKVAEAMHYAYEAAATEEGWETQERSRKPWDEVPDANKRTMLRAVAAALAVAEPLIREQERRRIAGALHERAQAFVHGTPESVASRRELMIAARIAREGQ